MEDADAASVLPAASEGGTKTKPESASELSVVHKITDGLDNMQSLSISFSDASHPHEH